MLLAASRSQRGVLGRQGPRAVTRGPSRVGGARQLAVVGRKRWSMADGRAGGTTRQPTRQGG